MLLSALARRLGRGSAQFLISRVLALAILAWLQTLPEFAVEAVIAWEAGRNPERAHLAIGNLRERPASAGLGWPMIYFVFAVAGRRPGVKQLPPISGSNQSTGRGMGLVPPLLYFLVVLWRQRIGVIDAAVLMRCTSRISGADAKPAAGSGVASDAPRVSRWAYRSPGCGDKRHRRTVCCGRRAALRHRSPFLNSMIALGRDHRHQPVLWYSGSRRSFRVSEFVSTFSWARA